MPRCPFARWNPLGASAGAFTSGPFKIVMHTTEGSTLAGALAALGSAHSESHFVVDAKEIVQLIDTSEASRSLRNAPGGVQTNKDSAIQIEMVGFAGKPKDRAMLANTRKLCRWIERTHGIPRVWPAGPLPMSYAESMLTGKRNPTIWDTKGGYYGHSQVPENEHWDPALTNEEVAFLMADEAAVQPSPVILPPKPVQPPPDIPWPETPAPAPRASWGFPVGFLLIGGAIVVAVAVLHFVLHLI